MHIHYSDTTRAEFQQMIWEYYRTHGRYFVWRETDDPYHIVVSEIMLQQTQTDRVQKKFETFIAALPDFKSLAAAPLRDVLALWQGLGYNRRAMALHKIAQLVVQEHSGILPNDPQILQTFPGLGPATAASICAFAFNAPTVFIETNIRTVFIHSFFPGCDKVTDKQLMPFVTQMLATENPRHWYYALMDYGVMLKKMLPNPSRKSAHHVKQSRFIGSDRQIRGALLRELVAIQRIAQVELLQKFEEDSVRVERILQQLLGEGFARRVRDCIELV